MSDECVQIGGAKVLICGPDGARVRSERDALDLMALAWEHGADWLALPVSRLDEDFFRLNTRVAGEITQKFVNYGVRLAVVGDIAPHLAGSKTLRDYVGESNQRGHVWFVDDLSVLESRLTERATQG